MEALPTFPVFPVFLMCVIVILCIIVFGRPKAKSVHVGSLETLPTLQEKPVSIGIYDRFTADGKYLNPKNYFVGRVTGFNGDLYLFPNDLFLGSSDFSDEHLCKDQLIVVLLNDGKYLLRKIIAKNYDMVKEEFVYTTQYDKNSDVEFYDFSDIVCVPFVVNGRGAKNA